jgi:capsular exopolysaccharide synthesis family protein
LKNSNIEYQASPTEKEDDIDIRRFIYRIIPYWKWVTLFFLLAFVLSFLYLRYSVPIYRASTRVVLNDDSQEKGIELLASLNGSYKGPENGVEEEIEVIKSRFLIGEVVKQLKFQVQWFGEGRIRKQPIYEGIPVEIFLDSLVNIDKKVVFKIQPIDSQSIQIDDQKVELNKWVNFTFGRIQFRQVGVFDPNISYSFEVAPLSSVVNKFSGALNIDKVSKYSAIVDVIINDPIPERGVAFLNALLSVYSSQSVEFKNRIYENTLKFVNDRLILVSSELAEVEGDMKSYKKEQGIIDLNEQGKLYLSQIKEADQKLNQLKIELSNIEEIEEYVKSKNARKDKLPATLGLNDPVLINQLNQLFQLEFQISTLESTSGPKNPQLIALKEQLDKVKPGVEISLRNLKNSLLNANASVSNEISKYNSFLQGIPEKEKLLLEISRQQQVKNGIFTFLLQKREEAGIAAASQVPNIRIIDFPKSNGVIKPRTVEAYLLAAICAIMVSALFIYFFEFNNDKILFREYLEQKSSIPVIGELVQGESPQGGVVVGYGQRTIISEQIREIRTNLSYLVSGAKSKVLLFTSSIPGEGKTFLSLNLAASIAQSGKKVVLLEFDLRKPKLSKQLNINKSPGISNFLISEVDKENIIRKIENEPGLDFIPSGHIPPNPAELIMNAKLDQLIIYLRNHYDYILIDAPPIGSVTDAKILATYADATIYLVRHNFTPKAYIDFIVKQKSMNILPDINLVFNGVDLKKSFGYYYGYSYGYGYGYSIENEQKSKKNWIKRLFS